MHRHLLEFLTRAVGFQRTGVLTTSFGHIRKGHPQVAPNRSLTWSPTRLYLGSAATVSFISIKNGTAKPPGSERDYQGKVYYGETKSVLPQIVHPRGCLYANTYASVPRDKAHFLVPPPLNLLR